jgi:copper chaperone CopZ
VALKRRTLAMRTIHLKVPTIKCEGCVEKIRGALTKRRGVQTVEGDPDRKEITVTFNPDQLGDAKVRAAVADAGFLVD